MSDIVLDCRHLDCPQPVMRIRKLLASAAPGELAVLVDNEPAVENVTRFLTSQGYIPQCEKQGEAAWRITAHMSTDGTSPAPKPGQTVGAPSPAADNAADNENMTLLLLTSPFIGSGDDTLGARLMKNFLSTVPEFGASLWRIVLLNGGVTLAIEQSPVLEELRALEKDGVDILVCGACLQHYNLLEKKAVGQVTNMLDIVTGMSLAHKVIRF